MTNELPMALEWSWIPLNRGCRNTIHQAIDVYTHWEILRMELELAHWALGTHCT